MATARIEACRKFFSLFSAPFTSDPALAFLRVVFLLEFTVLEFATLVGWYRELRDGSDFASELLLLGLNKGIGNG